MGYSRGTAVSLPPPPFLPHVPHELLLPFLCAVTQLHSLIRCSLAMAPLPEQVGGVEDLLALASEMKTMLLLNDIEGMSVILPRPIIAPISLVPWSPCSFLNHRVSLW